MISDPEERVKIDLQIDAFKMQGDFLEYQQQWPQEPKKKPSSSGCERNWSVFEMVHTKRRNRLHQQKMNDLVFVMYNLKLRNKNKKRSSVIQQPISLDDIPSDDEWITEREEPILLTEANWLDVLDRTAQKEARQALDDEADVDGQVHLSNLREVGGEIDSMEIFAVSDGGGGGGGDGDGDNEGGASGFVASNDMEGLAEDDTTIGDDSLNDSGNANVSTANDIDDSNFDLGYEFDGAI